MGFKENSATCNPITAFHFMSSILTSLFTYSYAARSELYSFTANTNMSYCCWFSLKALSGQNMWLFLQCFCNRMKPLVGLNRDISCSSIVILKKQLITLMTLSELFSQTWENSLLGHKRHYPIVFIGQVVLSMINKMTLMCKIFGKHL